MATIRYKTRKRLSGSNEFTQANREHLLKGFHFFGKSYPATPEGNNAMRADWFRHRASLMREHISKKPGTRPWAWWLYESKEPRRLLSGKAWDCSEKLSMGKPSLYERDENDLPHWEWQSEYLKRLNLLTPDERRALWFADEEKLKKGI